MTTVDQVAPLEPAVAAQPAGAPFDPTAAGAMPVASRLIGAIAIGVALLSAAATFVVMAGLTPIAPVHEVVVKLLLADLAAGLFLLAIIGREGWMGVRARLCRLAPACADRRAIRRHRRCSDRACGGGRQYDARPWPRPVLLDPH